MQSQTEGLHGAATLVDFVDLFSNPSFGITPSVLFQHTSTATSHAGPSRQVQTPGKDTTKGSRARTGCITCRLRKKVRCRAERWGDEDDGSDATRPSRSARRVRDWAYSAWATARSGQNGSRMRAISSG